MEKLKNFYWMKIKVRLCINCKGSEKNQPIEGLVILKGLTKDGNSWTNGKFWILPMVKSMTVH